MIDRLLHTPDGVRDILHEECQKKQALEKKLHRVFQSYGYRDLETPTFEFFDVFSREVGTTPSRELYKFFDREGNTLVLRPDFTPSIARAAAKYFHQEDKAVRLCYQGNTFINNGNYQGHLKESTQMGAELLGEESAEADAEMIAMAVELLRSSGLQEFQVSIGHVEFFKSLVAEAGFSDQEEQKLRSLISMKNFFGVEEFLESFCLRGKLKKALLSLPEMFGGGEILEKAEQLTDNQDALLVIRRLQNIYELLTLYGVEKYISFDLGMLNKYQYYTGVIFRGFTYGTGDAVVKGGRYDHLLARFGKPAPSIGFAVVVDQLLSAMGRQGIEIPLENGPTLLLYNGKDRSAAMLEAKKLRSEGLSVVLMEQKDTLESYENYGKRNGFCAVRRFTSQEDSEEGAVIL